jgi:hypothetical protein
METWYSVMVVDNNDCLVPIYFAKDKQVALEEFGFYKTQSSMEHRGHKQVIFSESTQVVEATRPMGELVNEEQEAQYSSIVK